MNGGDTFWSILSNNKPKLHHCTRPFQYSTQFTETPSCRNTPHTFLSNQYRIRYSMILYSGEEQQWCLSQVPFNFRLPPNFLFPTPINLFRVLLLQVGTTTLFSLALWFNSPGKPDRKWKRAGSKRERLSRIKNNPVDTTFKANLITTQNTVAFFKKLSKKREVLCRVLERSAAQCRLDVIHRIRSLFSPPPPTERTFKLNSYM